MYIDEESIETSVYYSSNDGGFHYVKFFFPTLGLYIDSFSVQKSPKHPEKGLWVQPPAIPNNGRFIKPMEFLKDSSALWTVLEAKARQAVEEKIGPTLTDEDFSQESIEKGLDEALKKMGFGDPP
jgi:hypothetical protein